MGSIVTLKALNSISSIPLNHLGWACEAVAMPHYSEPSSDAAALALRACTEPQRSPFAGGLHLSLEHNPSDCQTRYVTNTTGG
jgi:hypothetical protein